MTAPTATHVFMFPSGLSIEPFELGNIEVLLELDRRQDLLDFLVLPLAGLLADGFPVHAGLVLVAMAAALGENAAELLGLLGVQRQDLLPGGDLPDGFRLAALFALGGHEAVELGLLLRG